MIVMTEGTGVATNIGSGLAPLLSTDVRTYQHLRFSLNEPFAMRSE